MDTGSRAGSSMKITLEALQQILDDVGEVDEAAIRDATTGYRRGVGRRGLTHAEETRRKISATKTGRKTGPHSQERRERIRAGLKMSQSKPEVRAKISAALRGKTRHGATKQNQREGVLSAGS